MLNNKSTHKGLSLHNAFLASSLNKGNKYGDEYCKCNRECQESSFWIMDGSSSCFTAKKVSGSYEVIQRNQSSKCWLVCVDEGIISNAKSAKIAGQPISRCDSIVFNDNMFFYIEAKVKLVNRQNWANEISDAIKNKIPQTKKIIDAALSEVDCAITQNIFVVIPFSKSSVPKISRVHAKERLKKVCKKFISEQIQDLILNDVVEI